MSWSSACRARLPRSLGRAADEAVIDRRNHDQLGRNAFRAKSRVESSRLTDRHDLVDLAVNQQRRRILRIDVRRSDWRSATLLAHCAGAQPRYLPAADSASSTPGGGGGMALKSNTPYQATKPCTQSDWLAMLLSAASGSNDWTPQVVAASAANWPPAEPPQTIVFCGSTEYFAALARIHLMALFTS